MNFEILGLDSQATRVAVETPINDLYGEFATEFDRVTPVKDGWGEIESSDGEILPVLTRNPDYLREDDLSDNLQTLRQVEVSRSVAVGDSPVWGIEFYENYLTLRSCGVKNEDSKIWTPGVSLRYDAVIPRPLQLMRRFGLDMTVRARPFDDFGSNRRTVFDTGFVTEANEDTYEARLVKPALYVVTRAFAAMPDAPLS